MGSLGWSPSVCLIGSAVRIVGFGLLTAAEFSPSQSFFLLLVLPNTLSIICHIISATQNKKRMLSVEKRGRKSPHSTHY